MPGSDTIPDWMGNASPSTQSPTPFSSASTVASTATTPAGNDIVVPETAAEPLSADDEHGFIPGVEQVDGKVKDEKSSSPFTQVPPPSSSSAASSATVGTVPTKTDVAVSKAAAEWTASIDEAITNLAVFETSDNARAKELAARIVVVLRAARNTPPTAATALGTALGVVGAIFVWYAEAKAASAAKV
jgi:hypothetical protein